MSRPHARVSLLAAVMVACVAVLGACSEGNRGDDATPSSLSVPPTSEPLVTPMTAPPGFTVADTRGARLLPVNGIAGPALAPVPVYGGTATVAGTVTGPDGPVAGATVRVERFVGDRSGSVTVSAGADGRFVVGSVHGGRYRVRAWLQPSLASDGSSVAFLADEQGAVANFDLTVARHDGRNLQAALDLTSISVGGSARVRALFTKETVDDNGIVVGTGISGAKVTLSENAGYLVDPGSPNPGTTADSGLVSWKVTCQKEGSPTLTVTAQDLTATVKLPACAKASAPDVPDFAVGKTFKVPHEGVLPPGTYTTTNKGCATNFEVFRNGAWVSGSDTGDTLKISEPGRNFTAADGSKPCEYQRSA